MPEMRADQTRVKKLIEDTIILLCQQGLCYSVELKIQGVVAVTVDRCDTFVVQLDVTTTQNKNSTKRNPDLQEEKKAYVDNDDVIEVLPVVDLTRQEERQPPKPSTPRTPATPRGPINPGRRGVSSRNLFAQPVSPQVGVSPQRCRTQLTSSNCVSVGVASPVMKSPSRFSGPAQMAPSPVSACRPHKPASDAVMVIEDDRDDIVIVASDSGVTNRGGTLEKRVQQSMCGTTASNPPSPAVSGKISSRVSVSSDRCNLSMAETHASPSLASRDYKANSDALSVSSFSAVTSFLPSSVQSSGVYVPKTPDRPPAYKDVIITLPVVQSSILSSETSRPFVVTSSANSLFIPPTVSESPSKFVASTDASPNGTDAQVFRAVNGMSGRAVNGVSGRSAPGLNHGSYGEVQSCKTEEPCPADTTTVVLHQRPAYRIIDAECTLEMNMNRSSVDRTTSEVSVTCAEPLSALGPCRGNVVGLLTMDSASMTNATSQTKAVAVTSVGLNCSSPNGFILSSAQCEQTEEDYQKQAELVVKPHVILDADAREQELHPWVTKTESTPTNTDAQNWSQLLEVSPPTDSTPPEVYTDIAEDRSSDSRQTLVMDEHDEMQESSRFFTPFQCKFPGCVGSYVDGAQLANHYSITHTESLDLFKLKQSSPESTESPEASKSLPEGVQNSIVKNSFLCPSKGCEFVAELFCDVSAHHRQVHLRSISPRVRQQMIWRNRTCRSPRDSSQQLKAQTDVEELQNLLPEVCVAVESGDQHDPLSKKPLYGCLCIDGSCHWRTSNWDQLLTHMHLTHNFVIDSAKSTESSIKPEPLA